MAGQMHPVSQPVGMDTSGYMTGARQVIAGAIAMGEAFDNEVLAKIAQIGEAVKALPDSVAIRATVDMGQAMADIGQVSAAIREQAQLLREHASALGAMTAASRELGSVQAQIAATAGGAAGALRESAAAVRDFSAGQADAVQSGRDTAAVLGDVADGFDRVRVTSDGSGQSVLSYVDSLGRVRDAARDTTSALADTAAAVAAVQAAGGTQGGGGGTAGLWSSTTDAATAALIARNIARSGGTTSNTGDPAVAAALGALLGGGGGAGGGGGGGGGDPVAAYWGAVASSRFAGGQGGGDGGGAFLGGFLGNLRPSNIFGNATQTLKMAHLITMFTMESLSTILPAAVAAGAAGAAGLQGGTNLYTTGTSLYNATEALGGAYGKTFGSYLGLGSQFQADQNMANGGVYGIMGGVLNLAGQGKNAFGSMGVQTIAMIDRGIADMVLNNRMGAVAGALSGGTSDLRSFGDIGANIGDTLLNMAPALPGIGPDLLGGLKGITGAASWVTGHTPTGLLGAGLAAEAGYRWGDLVLAGGKMPWFLGGKQFGGMAGLAERLGLGTVGGEGAEASGLAGVLGGGGIGAVTAPLALEAYLVNKLATTKTPAEAAVAASQSAIASSFGANAWTPLAHALYQGTAGSNEQAFITAHPHILPGTSPQGLLPGARGGGSVRQALAQQAAGFPVFAQEAQSAAQQMGELVASGPNAVKALQQLGYKGTTLSQAFDIMTEAMVPMADIGKGGKINAQGAQLMKQFMQTYAPMTGTSGGAILEAASAQDVMSSAAMQSLSKINSAMDSYASVMMGGMSTAAQGTTARAGLPSGFGQALGTGPFTAAGSSAWTQFTTGTSTLPGVISSLQSSMDQLRTFLTLGALNSEQGGQLGAYQVQQDLTPVQRSGSGAALAMLMQQARQAGIPGVGLYNTGQSFAKNFAAFSKAINAASPGLAGATGLENTGTEKLANLPQIASNLINSQSGTSPLQLQQTTDAAKAADALQQAVAQYGAPGAKLTPQVSQPLSALVASLMAGGGVTGSNIGSTLSSVFRNEGIGGSALKNLVQQGTVIYHAEYEKSNPPVAHGTILYHVGAFPKVSAPTITGEIVYNAVVTGGAGGASRGVAGVAFHGQSGFKVPGTGSGDIVPAMLEPGELVVPRHIVAGGEVDHLRGRIPGFASGGLVGDELQSTLTRASTMINSLGSSSGNWSASQWGQMSSTFMQAAQMAHVMGQASPYASGGLVPASTLAGIKAQVNAEYTKLDAAYAADSNKADAATNAIWSVLDQLFAAQKKLQGTSGTAASSTTAAAAKTGTTAAQSVISSFQKTLNADGAPWTNFGEQLMNGLLAGATGQMARDRYGWGQSGAIPPTAAQAQALVNKVATEVNYGKNLASTTLSGLGLGSMQVGTPTMTSGGQPYQYYTDQANVAAGGQPGSVQQQMGDYLQAIQSFGGDIGKLSKGGLNKTLLGQLLSAGPIQGDALAQSILGGQGGIGAANSLYKQISAASNQLGVTGAESIYGAPATAGLHGKNVQVGVTASTAGVQTLQHAINALQGKTVTIRVNVAIGGGGGAGAGAGGGAGGILDLSKTDINTITREVQAQLLRQAKQNRRTGITLPGYGS